MSQFSSGREPFAPRPSSRRRSAGRRRTSRRWSIAGSLLLVGVVGLLGLVAWQLRSPLTPAGANLGGGPGSGTELNRPRPAPQKTILSEPQRTLEQSVAADQDRPDGESLADPGAMVSTEVRQRVAEMLADAQRAAAARRWTQASDALQLAADALQTAPADDRDRLTTAGFQKLVHCAEEFWRAVEDGWQQLEPGEELRIDSARAAIVQVQGQQIVLRIAGERREFSRGELPGQIAVAVAGRWLDPQSPTNKVLLGAFLATETEFQDPRISDLWRQAQGEGVPLDELRHLWPRLDASR